MQLDNCRIRRTEKFHNQVPKSFEVENRKRSTWRFEKMMINRMKTLEDNCAALESRIENEVRSRVNALIHSDALHTLIDARVNEILESSSTSSDPSIAPSSRNPVPTPYSTSESSGSSESESDSSDCSSSSSSSSSSCSSSSSESTTSGVSSTCVEPACSSAPDEVEEDLEEDDDQQEPSCSGTNTSPIRIQPIEHFTNKWEFISTFIGGKFVDFRIEQFADPVRRLMQMSTDEEVFPRMSLEEMIERDHPTTSNANEILDEKKITCRNRPIGKELTDEEFFCLAPCCSASRLYPEPTAFPFLPSFVQKRLVVTNSQIMGQRVREGIEIIVPVRLQDSDPVPQPPPMPVPEPEQEELSDDEFEDAEEEEEEDADPLADREIVQNLIDEYFLPTPAIPCDELIFGPYLRNVRDADGVPEIALHDLVRRINSNLDSNYDNHQELELFAELDNVPIDERHGRLPFDPMGN